MRLKFPFVARAVFILPIAALFLSTPSWGRIQFSPSVDDRGITFGGEFELTTKELVEKGGGDGETLQTLERKAALDFKNKVQERCPGCTITEEHFKWGHEYKVTHPDGYWFRISYDPGCVEIQTQPATLTELRARAASMNDVIFGSAHALGMDRDYSEGAGHMNFGTVSAFGNDGEESADAFLEYNADFADHPQLAEGAMGEDYTNAPPLNWLKQDQRDAFARIMKDAREHKIATIKDAAQRIQREVYTRTATHNGSGYHYQALSMKKLNQSGFPAKDAPLEIRAEYPQGSMEDFILDAEIISRRVEYLKTAKPPLVYFNIRRKALSYEEVVDMYYKYLDEMGLPYDKYKVMMPAEMQAIKPGEFVRGEITWSPEFAKSVDEFAPHIRTSEWAREKIMAAFTDSRIVSSETAQRSFVKLIKSIKPDSPTRSIEEQFVKDVLNHPIWQKVPSREGLIRFLKDRLPTSDWNDLKPTERPMRANPEIVPRADRLLPAGNACDAALGGE